MGYIDFEIHIKSIFKYERKKVYNSNELKMSDMHDYYDHVFSPECLWDDNRSAIFQTRRGIFSPIRIITASVSGIDPQIFFPMILNNIKNLEIIAITHEEPTTVITTFRYKNSVAMSDKQHYDRIVLTS